MEPEHQKFPAGAHPRGVAGDQRDERAPQRVFVVHGDPAPAAALATRVRRELGWTTVVPGYRDSVVIG